MINKINQPTYQIVLENKIKMFQGRTTTKNHIGFNKLWYFTQIRARFFILYETSKRSKEAALQEIDRIDNLRIREVQIEAMCLKLKSKLLDK